jgi:serine/threonine protein kinase/Flp pilus assembly protein TadD
MIGQVISNYRILSELGKGGMGTVYLAEHTLLGRRVAIKTLSIEPHKQHYRGRFLREAQAASALSHPNIANVYDYGQLPDGHPFIVMELIEGQTLSDVIGCGELALPRAVEVIEKVAEALCEAHRQGIVHRDVKPTNIAINKRAEVKVLDFGLAKQLRGGGTFTDDGAGASALQDTETREDVIIGTPSYLSPEQALGLPVDQRCDLFSLGAVLYECITGRLAFPGESAAAIRSKVIRDDPPPPSSLNPDVPPELNRVTLKALAKKPEQRYQSAEELLSDLKDVHFTLPAMTSPAITRRQHSTPQTGHTSTLTALSRAQSRPRLLAAVFLPIFASAVLIAWYGSSRSYLSYHQPAVETLRLYERGVEALHNGGYHKASLMLSEAVKADDQFPLAHARLAEAWSELDYSDRAKDEIIRISQLLPDRSALPPLDALYLQAITDTIARDYPSAIEGYRRIAVQSPPASKAAALLDVGRAYEKSENLEEAIKNFEEASRHDPNYAAAFLRLGITYGRKQELRKAQTAFDEAERLYQTFGDLEGVTEALYQRGALLNKIRMLGEARTVLTEALEKAKATRNTSQQVLTLLQLSSVIFGQGDVPLAQKYASDAVDSALARGMENLTARGLIDLGNSFFSKGSYAEAEEYFKRALEYARNNRGRRNEARALLSLGSLYSQVGKKDEARRYVEQSLPFYREGGYLKEVSLALTILGHLYDQGGEYDAALATFEEQAQAAQRTGDESQAALAKLGSGLVLLHQERFAEALERFDASLTLHRKLGIQQNIGHLLVHRGHALLQLGRLEESRVELTEAEALRARAGGFGEFNALTSLLAARIALAESRPSVARAESGKALLQAGQQYWAVATEATYFLGLAESRGGTRLGGTARCEAAVSLAEKYGDPRLFAYALLARAETFLRAGSARRAEEAARRALEISERLGQLESAWRAALIAARANRLLKLDEVAGGYESRAASLLEQFGRRLPGGAIDTYLARPDVRGFRQERSADTSLSGAARWRGKA